jgi:cytochrome c-type biogenesis protein CcmH/NrfG
VSRTKDRSAKIAAHVYIGAVCFVLIVAGLYLVLCKDRALEANWYDEAAQLYFQKAQTEVSQQKKDYLEAATQTQVKAVQTRPYDSAHWKRLSVILTARKETQAARQALNISKELANDTSEIAPLRAYSEEFP